MRHGGGADLAAWGQAVELSKHHNVSVICDNSTTTSTGRLIESENGINFHRYPVKPRNIRSVAKEICKFGFDAMSTHTVPMDLLAVQAGIPHILHDYGLPNLSITLRYESLKYWGIVNATRFYSAHHPATKMILPSSSYIARDLKRLTHHNKPTYILHSGITFPDTEEVKTFTMDEPYILFIGRHVRYKQVDQLIRLFAHVRKQNPRAHLVTAGLMYDEFYSKILADMAESVGNVHLLGYVEDAWPLIKGASVYATCSLYEGEDRPALEAQSMGVPVVAWDTYSHPEVVKNGYCAVDDRDFIQALVQYLQNDHRDMNTAQLIRREYSLQRVAERYNKLLKTVI
jgi:glycosyltransferase involved in cell wall biosynthesis